MTTFVLSGGHVVDPSQGLDAVMDVVVRDGRIAAIVPPGTPRSGDTWVEDVSGSIVSPGFVDLHGHWYEGSAWGIDPLINLRSGVTTPCDAGSTGYVTFPLFRKIIEAGAVRVLVFLHIGSLGAVSMNAGSRCASGRTHAARTRSPRSTRRSRPPRRRGSRSSRTSPRAPICASSCRGFGPATS
jgi:dihydroorotase